MVATLVYEMYECDVREQNLAVALIGVQRRRTTALVHHTGCQREGYDVVVRGRWLGYWESLEQAEALIRQCREGV